MAGGKETPRQKLVGLMYLVLMSLLAMNVSKEVLDAFIKVDQSLKDAKLATLVRNENILAGLSNKVSQKGPEDKKWYSLALKSSNQITELINYIEQTKAKIIEETLGLPDEDIPVVLGKWGNYDTVVGLEKLKALDDYNTPTRVLGLSEPGSPTEGEYQAKTIKNKIDQLLKEMDQLLVSPFKDQDERLKSDLRRILNVQKVKTQDGMTVSWEADNFHNATLGAAVVLLSDLQVKLTNAQEMVLKYFYDQVGGNEVRVNSIEPLVIPNSSYVLKGDYYQAKVKVAAVDTTAKPRIQIGNTLSQNGGKYSIVGAVTELKDGDLKIKTDKVGQYKQAGIIELKEPSGNIRQYPFEFNYTVAEPSATVSPTAMNVFYAGVDNPLAISAPGFQPADLIIRAEGATLKPAGAGYVARVNGSTQNAYVIVAAKIDGKEVLLSKSMFRVKGLPRPTTVLGGGVSKDEQRSVGYFKSFSEVQAEIPDFLFDVKIKVESFICNIITTNGRSYRYNATTNLLTEDMKKAIAGLLPNDMVIFKEVKAKMPDGSSVFVYPITITIK